MTLLTFIPGIRNFIVGITVKIASDEATLRREKTYVNKLNLALVQVRPRRHSVSSVHLKISSLDPEAGMATQLADVHFRARGIFQDESLTVREQHGHLATSL